MAYSILQYVKLNDIKLLNQRKENIKFLLKSFDRVLELYSTDTLLDERIQKLAEKINAFGIEIKEKMQQLDKPGAQRFILLDEVRKIKEEGDKTVKKYLEFKEVRNNPTVRTKELEEIRSSISDWEEDLLHINCAIDMLLNE